VGVIVRSELKVARVDGQAEPRARALVAVSFTFPAALFFLCGCDRSSGCRRVGSRKTDAGNRDEEARSARYTAVGSAEAKDGADDDVGR